MQRFFLITVCALIPSFTTAHSTPVVQYFWENETTNVITKGRAKQESQFAIASVGKLFTAAAIAKLVDHGVLSFEDPLSKWIDPSVIQNLNAEDVTLANALNMTTGLPDYYSSDFVEDAFDDDPRTKTAQGALRYVFGVAKSFQPGTRFEYSNTNYLLAQLVMEAATKEPYAKTIEKSIFRPLGLNSSFVFGTKDLSPHFVSGHSGWRHVREYYNGQGFGDGGIISTAGDVARFYRALFWEKTVLKPATLDRILQDPLGVGYGMGVSIDGNIIGHSGADLGFVSDVRMDITTGNVAVILIGSERKDTGWAADQFD